MRPSSALRAAVARLTHQRCGPDLMELVAVPGLGPVNILAVDRCPKSVLTLGSFSIDIHGVVFEELEELVDQDDAMAAPADPGVVLLAPHVCRRGLGL